MKKIALARGVYTVTCASCGQNTIMHIDENGDTDPKQCSACKVNFIDIEKGQVHNEYIGQVADESLLEKLTNEVKKTSIKSSKKKTKKSQKKSSRSNEAKKSSDDKFIVSDDEE